MLSLLFFAGFLLIGVVLTLAGFLLRTSVKLVSRVLFSGIGIATLAICAVLYLGGYLSI